MMKGEDALSRYSKGDVKFKKKRIVYLGALLVGGRKGERRTMRLAIEGKKTRVSFLNETARLEVQKLNRGGEKRGGSLFRGFVKKASYLRGGRDVSSREAWSYSA